MSQSFWSVNPGDSHTISPELIRTTRALWALANAATWDDTYRVLVDRRLVLLSERTLALLRVLIEEARDHHEVAEAENWGQYLGLLEDASVRGIDMAWQHFMATQQQTIEVLDALVEAGTDDELHSILGDQQAVLLTYPALVILRGSMSKRREEGSTELAERLERLLRLLEDARKHGVAAAWDNFKDA